MGLDISIEPGIDSFRAGSYSGFSTWREWLAAQAGMNLNAMQGFGGSIPWTGAEPFADLLNHSDCDGQLNRSACKRLSKDFSKYLLKVMQNPVVQIQDQRDADYEMADDDYAYFVQRYLRWKDAVNMVADGTATRLVFC